jgi:hypothetical protein
LPSIEEISGEDFHTTDFYTKIAKPVKSDPFSPLMTPSFARYEGQADARGWI